MDPLGYVGRIILTVARRQDGALQVDGQASGSLPITDIETALAQELDAIRSPAASPSPPQTPHP